MAVDCQHFLVHHGTLVHVYKAKLADALRGCGLYDAVPAEAWTKTFVVDIQPVGDGRAVLKYLAPYVHRVAISDSRIVACDESSVTYSYTPSGTKQTKTRTVPGIEFVRGFVQHTLPPRFQKIRHYGWMSSNSEVGLDEVKWLVWLFLGWTFWLASSATRHNVSRCPNRKYVAQSAAARCEWSTSHRAHANSAAYSANTRWPTWTAASR